MTSGAPTLIERWERAFSTRLLSTQWVQVEVTGWTKITGEGGDQPETSAHGSTSTIIMRAGFLSPFFFLLQITGLCPHTARKYEVPFYQEVSLKVERYVFLFFLFHCEIINVFFECLLQPPPHLQLCRRGWQQEGTVAAESIHAGLSSPPRSPCKTRLSLYLSLSLTSRLFAEKLPVTQQSNTAMSLTFTTVWFYWTHLLFLRPGKTDTDVGSFN